jgi:uncharacterized membrane protein YccC
VTRGSDLELARRETVAILRRMAELIERAGEDGGNVAALEEIRRLRRRALQLRAELKTERSTPPVRLPAWRNGVGSGQE